MLLAVSMGRSQPWTLNLSSRRWIRLLRWRNCWRLLRFTRNPSFGAGVERLATNQTPQKAGGFRDFCFFPAQQPLRYACLRASGGQSAAHAAVPELLWPPEPRADAAQPRFAARRGGRRPARSNVTLGFAF